MYARALLRASLYLPVWVWGVALYRLSHTYWASVRHGKRNAR